MSSFYDSKLPGVKSRECQLVYAYFIFIIGLIIMYTIIVSSIYGPEHVSRDDPLNFLMTGEMPGIGPISGWRLAHFVAFFVAGFLFPNCMVLIFILGVVWEMIEYVVGNLSDKFVPRKDDKANIKMDGVMYHRNGWVDGDVADIIYNTAGMFLGAGLRKGINFSSNIIKSKRDKLKLSTKKKIEIENEK